MDPKYIFIVILSTLSAISAGLAGDFVWRTRIRHGEMIHLEYIVAAVLLMLMSISAGCMAGYFVWKISMLRTISEGFFLGILLIILAIAIMIIITKIKDRLE